MKTQAQLAEELKELKEKFNNVYTLTVPTNDEETEFATVFLKKLDRPTYKVVSALIQKDELNGVESLIKSLRIGGDEATAITDNFDALRSASLSLIPMLSAKQGELKKN